MTSGWTRPEEAIIFVGSLFSSRDILASAEALLTERFGEVVLCSPVLRWDHSGYYDEELGVPIRRRFLFFGPVVDTASLPDIKRQTREIEELFSVEGRRRINLDPGYVTLAKVVLASRKNYSHRIKIGTGVFAELELFYRDGRFNMMPYTYSDYRDEGVLRIFTRARGFLKKSLVNAAAQ